MLSEESLVRVAPPPVLLTNVQAILGAHFQAFRSRGIRLGLTARPPPSFISGGFNIMRNRSFDTFHIDSEERDR